jgi:putative hemolysin
MNDCLIDLNPTSRSPLHRTLFSMVKSPLETLLSIRSLNRAYGKYRAHPKGGNFFADALRHLDIRYEVTREDRDKIPTDGPLLVIANHPFGGVDGLILGALLTSARSDVKLLANYLLGRMPEIRPWLIPVDPFAGKNAKTRNIEPLRETVRWLKSGGVVGSFPSGTVSFLQMYYRQISDPEWSRHIAILLRKTRASALPIYFEGRNSAIFQLLGLVHPLLRTAMLPRELVNKSGRTLRVRIGKPIPYARLEGFDSDEEMVKYLRLKTYILKNRAGTERNPRFFAVKKQAPLIPPVRPSTLLQEEIDALPEDSLLASQVGYSVHVAEADRIPNVLREIGRLREKTFREVGEGTGNPCDIDLFDSTYLHLFMWNRETLEIVGAYRLGLTDRILARYGKGGLYTSTLFRFKDGFFDQLNPAIELGRSFICSGYQKKHLSLSLIWKGIGAFLVRHPRYKVLFGPVSISRDYNTLSKNLMIQFLKNERTHPRLSPLVRAKHPPRTGHLAGLDRSLLRDIDDVSALISEIETDHKGVPVLLRHYLKLNGKLLSFNVDSDFSRVIDGLILVDLELTDPRLLKRFMGIEGYRRFSTCGKVLAAG